MRELFQREAETLDKLDHHSQIPQLLAFFEENQEFYLVQEFIKGKTLTQELASRRPYTEDETREFLAEVLGILQFVHKEGVIHRDIKPDNLIRRSKDKRLVLIDFGSVKSLVSQSSNETQVSTPGYTPPEQMLGHPQFNSDIYALGMTAIQMITGLEPRNLGKSNKGEVSWRDEVEEEFRTQLPAIIDKMVRQDTKCRYQSVDEVLKDVQHAGKTKIAVVSQDNSDRGGNFKLIINAFIQGEQKFAEEVCNVTETTAPFACQTSNGVPVTRVTEAGKEPKQLIRWFRALGGVPPEQRCEQVSARLNTAFRSGDRYVTHGKMNNQPVICTTDRKGNGCKQLLWELHWQDDDPQTVLDDFLLLINTNYFGRPLRQ